MNERTPADPGPADVATVDATAADVAPDGSSAIDMRSMFRPEASAAERMAALTGFVTTLHGRLRDVATAAGDSLDVVAERSGYLLSEIADRLPIRTADELRDAYGPDPVARADRVIDDAATLARWLWAAAHAIPAPPKIVHAAKAIVHSAIEIRMVGELHEAHRDPQANQEPTPLAAVLTAWLTRTYKDTDLSVGSVAAIVMQVRRTLADLRGNDGRIKGLLNRGKEGGELVRRLGTEMSRSLRQSPTPS